jgi:flagellin-like hook-associated protein FlgL
MSDIVLSAGVRSNLLQLQKTSDLISSTQTKLATGKRVNSALDNPINFFTAQGLSNRASDLTALLDSMSNGINTIQAANNGLTSITKLVQSAQALISQAQQTSDTTVRASLATQFGALQTQINTLGADSGFNGINLLAGNNLTVTLNETGSSSVTVTAVTFDSAGLGINNATNNWACGRHHCRRRPDYGVDKAAFAGPGLRFKPVDRADPPGLHQVDGQHIADRCRIADPRRLQRGRRELAGPADAAGTVHHRPIPRLAGQPSRVEAVPIERYRAFK